MISFKKYDFACSWQTDALLPSYWGSTLRGGLGKWLKKVSCILRAARCEDCAVRASCAYGYVFETEICRGRGMGAVNARPHPIVLDLPYPCNFSTREGQGFCFSIILLDGAITFFPHILYALLELGQRDGIGARTRDGHGRFYIESVTTSGELVYSKDKGEIALDGNPGVLCLEDRPHGSPTRISIDFLTPFRVKYRGRFVREVPFHVLVRAALRRIASLEEAYGDGEPDLDYGSIIRASEDVHIVRQDLAWCDVPRYSSRQKRKMMMGGPVGKVVYQGRGLEMFLPLLKYCETVHLGKQTFFGLGKIGINSDGPR